MKNTDKTIQKLLKSHEDRTDADQFLEDNIMNKIQKRSDYTILLAKSKRNARIGIYISMILLAIYAVITYLELFSLQTQNHTSLEVFYPTVFTAIVVIIIYFEMTLSLSVLKKTSKKS